MLKVMPRLKRMESKYEERGDSHLISLVFVEAADKYREFPRRGYGSPLLSYES